MKARASNWGKAYGGRSTRKVFEVSLGLFMDTVSSTSTLLLKRDISNTDPPDKDNVESMKITLDRETAMILATRLRQQFAVMPACINLTPRDNHPSDCPDCERRLAEEYALWERAAKKTTS
jgi:hypothetical protein